MVHVAAARADEENTNDGTNRTTVRDVYVFRGDAQTFVAGAIIWAIGAAFFTALILQSDAVVAIIFGLLTLGPELALGLAWWAGLVLAREDRVRVDVWQAVASGQPVVVISLPARARLPHAAG